MRRRRGRRRRNGTVHLASGVRRERGRRLITGCLLGGELLEPRAVFGSVCFSTIDGRHQVSVHVSHRVQARLCAPCRLMRRHLGCSDPLHRLELGGTLLRSLSERASARLRGLRRHRLGLRLRCPREHLGSVRLRVCGPEMLLHPRRLCPRRLLLGLARGTLLVVGLRLKGHSSQ